TVVSTIRSQPPMIADELRRQADNFIELQELEPVIAREPKWRNERARNLREPMEDEYEEYDDEGDEEDMADEVVPSA
ncbi:MAG: NYN domain-containing protein, partial [Rhodospirillales bacterium]|nr:NYN domain-containing protein [Rhodospirillales bacterium]